jgi:acetate kinase
MSVIMSLNSGSSSCKFQLYTMPAETVICSGIFERIGLAEGTYTMEFNGSKVSETLPLPNHQTAIQILLKLLIDHGVVASLDDLAGIGHRVVHGGEKYEHSVVFNEEVAHDIEMLCDLAPLHNPANLLGYQVLKELLPNTLQVAVFDTAFHQTMDKVSFMYPIPLEYYDQYKIRKYGFHGTSHLYVTQRARTILGEEKSRRLICCHLGNGGSLSAVLNGQCINTSMGFTPLAGIMMGTRSGDIDPSIMAYLAQKEGLSVAQITDICNKKSGILGISKVSSDMRDIEAAIAEGNENADLARKMYVQRVAMTIGSYIAQLGGCDAILFTAGIGENSVPIRQLVIEYISEAFSIELDVEANKKRRQEVLISTPQSKIAVMVIPTNEELMIARDTFALYQH